MNVLVVRVLEKKKIVDTKIFRQDKPTRDFVDMCKTRVLSPKN